LSVSVQAPGWAAKVPVGERAGLPIARRIADAWAALDRIAAVLDSIRPKGSVISGKVSAEHERYFALKELADAIGETLNRHEARREDSRLARLEGRQPDAVGRRPRYRAIKLKKIGFDLEESQPLRSIASAESMEDALRELFESAEPLPEDADLFDVENRLALLNLMATAPPDDRPGYLWVRGFPDGGPDKPAEDGAESYRYGWVTDLGLDVVQVRFEGRPTSDYALQVKGIHARPLALTEVGTHLVLPKHGGPVPVRVDVVDSWPPRLADPHAFGAILRVYPEGQPVMDVRTG